MSNITEKNSIFNLDEKEKYKILIMAIVFFCAIGAFTIIKEMKDILFVQLVGKSFLPKAKIASLFFLIPATFLYSKLVDLMNRFNLIYFYTFFYSFFGILLSILIQFNFINIAFPSGLFDKYIGWAIYLIYEGFNPFLVSLIWSFTNSITNPEFAKKNYFLIVSGSKMGGMFTAALGWALFSGRLFKNINNGLFFNYFLLILISSFLLIAIPFLIKFLVKKVGKDSLHGYEAAYILEKEKKKEGKAQSGIFSGIILMFKYPYIFGIFGMFFFYEMINVVLGFQKIFILKDMSNSVDSFSSLMFEQRFFMHLIGFIISFFGTGFLMQKLGIRLCLLLIPIFIGILVTYFMIAYDVNAVLIVFTILGALNYAFAQPVRENLYIPTIKDIRFKSKSWIDSFGLRFSKFSAALFSNFAEKMINSGAILLTNIYSIFFGTIIFSWLILAWFLGKKYNSVIKNNKVIGE